MIGTTSYNIHLQVYLQIWTGLDDSEQRSPAVDLICKFKMNSLGATLPYSSA